MQRILNLFPLWAILLAALAYHVPQPFAALKNSIVPLLAGVMFCMGMTLTWLDIKTVLKQSKVTLLALLIQFGLMPMFAWVISFMFNFPTDIMTGMVLVGASAGGTASNVICYLAKGDVALSVLMTTISTLAAILLMPGLSWLYLSKIVPVPVMQMLQSLVLIVLLPVIAGAALNTRFQQPLKPVHNALPLLAGATVILIIAIIVGLNQSNLALVVWPVFVAVLLHNGCGLFAGYGLARLAGYEPRIARTVCIEVGMQNSGLSVALAIKYYSAMAALPGALFSIWHNVSGSLLAFYWRQCIQDKNGME